MITEVRDENGLLGTIIRSSIVSEGHTWFTEDKNELQVGVASHKAGYEVLPHRHSPLSNLPQTLPVQEVLFIETGRVRLTFYVGDNPEFVLYRGDVAILHRGVHGLKVLEDARIWEVKQGPYHSTNKVYEGLQ